MLKSLVDDLTLRILGKGKEHSSFITEGWLRVIGSYLREFLLLKTAFAPGSAAVTVHKGLLENVGDSASFFNASFSFCAQPWGASYKEASIVARFQPLLPAPVLELCHVSRPLKTDLSCDSSLSD